MPSVESPGSAAGSEGLNILFTNRGDQLGNRGHQDGLFGSVPGENKDMQLRKVIQRRIRRSGEGVDLVGDVNAAISANVGEKSSSSHVSSRSTVSARAQEREEARGETQDRENA